MDENATQVVPDEEVWTMDGEGGSAKSAVTSQEFLRQKERRVLYEEPLAEFTLPSGKVIRIYAKSEGQLAAVDEAFQRWFDARVKGFGKTARRWWHWGWRRKRVADAQAIALEAKLRMFQAILEDRFDEEKDQKLTVEELLSIPVPMQADIWSAFREAQHAGDLIAAMFPDADSGKKKGLLLALSPTGTHP